MILEELRLINFRLHTNTKINFSDKINYIVGGNGQGKTSILEAIYYICTSKGLNQNNDSEAVNFNSNSFEIKGNFSDLTKNESRLFYSAENKKKVLYLDEKQVFRISEFIGKFPVVTITQADHEITAGSPAERRKFVDSVISQASNTYLKTLVDYNKILKNRAVLLNQIKEKGRKDFVGELDSWNDSLIKNGAYLIKNRNQFIEEFKIYLENAYNNILDEKEKPGIEYKTLCSSIEIEEIKNDFQKRLKEIKEEEIIRGVNLIGPHRDDYVFYINGLEIKKYGSQGQNKTFQVALRFGEFFYLKDKLGKTPVFLMDDVFGELDKQRSESISSFLNKTGQTFITMTDFTRFGDLYKSSEDKLIYVNKGEVSYA